MATAANGPVPNGVIGRRGAAGRVLRWLAAIATIVAAFALWSLIRVPTTAPVRLISTVPADGAVLVDPPGAVELTLSASPDVGGSLVTVRDESGAVVNSGELSLAGGRRLRQPATLRSPGQFSVVYHVAITSGQDMVGVIRFSVGARPEPASGSTVAAPAAHEHSHGVDPAGAALLVLDAAVLLSVLVLLWQSRRGAIRKVRP